MDAIKTGVTSRRNSTITEQDYKDLIEAVIYDQGNLYWIMQRNGRAKSGQPVYDKLSEGNNYRRIKFNNKKFYYHRVIYYMFHRELPEIVDHIDGNKLNNRIENLRGASPSLNGANSFKGKRDNTSSKYKGVCYRPTKISCYHASIMVNKKSIHIGSFLNERDAALAYDNAAIHYFGEFAKTNKMLGLL